MLHERKSEQPHIPHTNPLLDNDTGNECKVCIKYTNSISISITLKKLSAKNLLQKSTS